MITYAKQSRDGSARVDVDDWSVLVSWGMSVGGLWCWRVWLRRRNGDQLIPMREVLTPTKDQAATLAARCTLRLLAEERESIEAEWLEHVTRTANRERRRLIARGDLPPCVTMYDPPRWAPRWAIEQKPRRPGKGDGATLVCSEGMGAARALGS